MHCNARNARQTAKFEELRSPGGFEFASGLGRAACLAALLGLAACGPGGSEPVLQSVEDQLVAVNQELVILLNASDQDGDEVFYDFESNVPDIYSRATLTRLPIGAGEFRWTPEARDVGEWFFDFTAFDGGLEDTITIRVEVRAAIGGNSAPRFVHPQGSGTTLDLTVSDCLSLDVEVVDGDSAEVVLGQGEPLIEGASLEQVSGLSGNWSWCPSVQQIETDDRYTLLLTADDGDNPTKLHPYLVVLRSPLKPDCPGEAPIITHAPSNLDSLVGVTIDAAISDDVGLKQEPLLYYSNTPPSNPPDLSQMIQVTMVPEDGTLASANWSAQIPNPVVGEPVGSTAQIYYIIVANDDDDSEGSCDHLTQEPVEGTFQMSVSNPGGAGGAGLCEPCTADIQCGEAGDLCVLVGNGSDAFCLQDCAQSCPSDYECSASPLESVDGTNATQCVPVSLDCSNPGGVQCSDDLFEDNDSRTEAEANALLPASSTHDLVSCPSSSGVGDDEDWFEIFLAQEGQIDINLAGGSQSDLDIALYENDGSFITSSVSLSSVESISRCLPQGFYFIRAHAFGPVENAYTLSYSLSPQSCSPTTCQADVLEEDDDATQATFVDLSGGPVIHSAQTLCSLDEDWYEVELFNDQLLSVDLTFDQLSTGGDLDIHLFNAASVDQTPCSPADVQSCDTTNGQSGTSNESAIYAAPSTGCTPCTFYVVVQGFNGDENDYDIRIESI